MAGIAEWVAWLLWPAAQERRPTRSTPRPWLSVNAGARRHGAARFQ